MERFSDGGWWAILTRAGVRVISGGGMDGREVSGIRIVG